MIIISLSIGALFFICTLSAYILGLRHGKTLASGNIPKLQLNPIQAIIERVDAKKEAEEAKKIEDELATVMGYSAEAALLAAKAKGR